MIANSCRLFNNTEEKIMKLKEFINKAVSVAMCAMIIGTTVVSVNVKADTKVSMEAADALDTHIDDGVVGILEKDDFENPEDYQKYLESHPQLQKQQSRLAARASANKNVKAKATLKYKITGLPSTAAIQKTYIGSTYIYVIQRSGSNSYLSRCVINGTTATYQDHMYLKNFGHGQTLEWFEHNSKPYFWVTCKANESYDIKWGTQIGRLQYEAGRTIDYTEIPRFSHLSYANKSGTSIGEVKRVDAAMSSNGNKIMFWVMDNTGEIQYSFYNTEKLNAVLDKAESKSSKYIPCTSSAVKAACSGSLRQSGSNRVLPNNSCQGLEFTDADSIYVIGGAAGDTPKIAKMTGSGSNYKYACLTTVTHSNFGSSAEAEGIQLKGDYVYFGISDKSKSDRACIYSIPKSVF